MTSPSLSADAILFIRTSTLICIISRLIAVPLITVSKLYTSLLFSFAHFRRAISNALILAGIAAVARSGAVNSFWLSNHGLWLACMSQGALGDLDCRMAAPVQSMRTTGGS